MAETKQAELPQNFSYYPGKELPRGAVFKTPKGDYVVYDRMVGNDGKVLRYSFTPITEQMSMSQAEFELWAEQNKIKL